MNIEKFKEIVGEEARKMNYVVPDDPNDWRTVKPKIEKYIKEVDKAAEVYEMENTKKGEK